MFRSVLMVCIGNVCRSPVAEALLKYYAQQHQLDIRVGSAGVQALVNQPPQPYSQEVAAAHGLAIADYYAEQITSEMVAEYDLIMVLDDIVRQDLLQRFPNCAGKVKKLGFLNNNLDVADPYKLDKSHFIQMYADIDACLKSWLSKVWQVPKSKLRVC